MTDRGVGMARRRFDAALFWIRLVLLIMVAGPFVGQAQAQGGGNGVLEGLVANGTEGGPQVGAGIDVDLYLVGSDAAEPLFSTTTDADGRFRFEGLDTSADLQYWVEAIYGEMPYGSAEMIQYAEGQTTLETTVMVYETTEDDTGVQLGLVHIFAESFGQVLRISETHLFGSNGDRTYIGQEGDEGRRLTVFIPLPEDAVGFAVGEGLAEDRFLTVDEGLVDSDPVRPGSLMSEVRFSYHVMVTGNRISLERTFAYPVADLTVLVSQPGLSLVSPQLQSMGVQSIQNSQYEILAGQIADPGQPVTLQFTVVADADGGTGSATMPGTQTWSGGASGGKQSLLLWLGVGLAVIAGGAAVFYVAYRRPAGRRTVSAPQSTFDPTARELIARLADLEDALEAGEINEEAYVRQRMDLFKELG